MVCNGFSLKNTKILSSNHKKTAIFFPMAILNTFFSNLLIYGGLGFWGWSFHLMGFGACGVEPSGFLGLGLFI